MSAPRGARATLLPPAAAMNDKRFGQSVAVGRQQAAVGWRGGVVVDDVLVVGAPGTGDGGAGEIVVYKVSTPN